MQAQVLDFQTDKVIDFYGISYSFDKNIIICLFSPNLKM
jgi:hypothetical protein